MRALDKKLRRELWQMRGQVLAIALVIVGGVAIAVMSLSTYDSLLATRDRFYQTNHFADVFVNVKRAPIDVLARLKQIRGIDRIDDRVVAGVHVRLPDFHEPVSATVQSLPSAAAIQNNSNLGRLHLLRGRMPDNSRELLVSDGFAEAHSLRLSSTIDIVINGRWQRMTVVGVGASPEYIYQIAPGAALPDFKRYGVFWMQREALALAYDMSSAFNQLAIVSDADYNETDAVIQDMLRAIDAELKPYGGVGAYSRSDHFSHRFVEEEFRQLQQMAVMFPLIFMGVAMFLLNIAVRRLIAAQREVIGVLRAFGYSNYRVAFHYAEMIAVIAAIGIVIGAVVGAWLGNAMTAMYAEYYRFPTLIYTVRPALLLLVAAIVMVLSFLGCVGAVLSVAKLTPVEAMRPESPKNHGYRILAKSSSFSAMSMMLVRQLFSQPLRSILSVLGIASACAISMVGNFQEDAVVHMMHVQFALVQKEDVSASLAEPSTTNVYGSLKAIDGVRYVEGLRSVAVRFRHGQHDYRGAVTGIPQASRLRVIMDDQLDALPMLSRGLLLSEALAKELHAEVGDILSVEVLEGAQPKLQLPVAAIARQYLGAGAYMDLLALNRALGDSATVNQLLLSIDEEKIDGIFSALESMPRVVSIQWRKVVIDTFYDIMEQMMLVFTAVNAALGSIVAFGVVYNVVRIALAERQRTLSTLRVLGYRQSEVAYLLLGELAILCILALPIGFLFGYALCELLVSRLQTDMYTIPLVLNVDTYAKAGGIVAFSAMLSAWIAWRKLRSIRMVDALKAKD